MTLREAFESISTYLVMTKQEILQLPSLHILDWPIKYLIVGALGAFVIYLMCAVSYFLALRGFRSLWYWLTFKLRLNKLEEPLNRLQEVLGRLSAFVFIWIAIAGLLMAVTASKLIVLSLPSAVCVALLWLSSLGRRSDG